MRTRNLNPLFLAVSLSAFIHGGLLRLVSADPRPAPPEKNRAVLVNILPTRPEKAPAVYELPEVLKVPKISEVLENSEIPPVTETPIPEVEAADTAEMSPAESSSPVSPQTPAVSAPFVRPAQSAQSNLREDAVNRYAAMIHGLIDRRKQYPYRARRQDQEGTVRIRFTLSRHGVLTGDPVLEKQSRYRLLNESAVDAVKNAAPYPPFPEEIPEAEMSFQVAISFSL